MNTRMMCQSQNESSREYKSLRNLLRDGGGGHYPWPLPYKGFIGKCCFTGYVFLAFWSGTGYKALFALEKGI